MVIEIKKGDTPEDIKKKLHEISASTNGKRAEMLEPFFGILKRDIDPLKLQKKWRDEWE